MSFEIAILIMALIFGAGVVLWAGNTDKKSKIVSLGKILAIGAGAGIVATSVGLKILLVLKLV